MKYKMSNYIRHSQSWAKEVVINWLKISKKKSLILNIYPVILTGSILIFPMQREKLCSVQLKQWNSSLTTSSALFISSSDCSVLLLCSVWWREESMLQEKVFDSMSIMAALPSLPHKLTSAACSEGGGSFRSALDSSGLK